MIDLKKEAIARLRDLESDTLEYASILPPSKIIAQLISAFANTKGGYIILGVDSENNIIGLSEDSKVDKIMENALNLLSTQPNMQHQYVLHQGKKLYAIKIEKSETLILVENTSYKRIGTTLFRDESVQLIASKKNEEPIKQKILFLAANPMDKDLAELEIGSEYRTIKKELRNNPYLELLLPEMNSTIQDFIRAMNQKPQIVHFAGHGNKAGIFISDDNNYAQLMPTKALQRIFNQHKENIKLVVLNACYSETQAKVISEFGIYVIGMTTTIKDSESMNFASGLYTGLSEGKILKDAYDDAMIVLETKHPNLTLPQIWKDGKPLDW